MKLLHTLVFTILFSPSLFSQWQQTSGPEGGRAFAIESINGTLWAGTQGGLYKSYDDGITWFLSDQVPLGDAVTTIKTIGSEIFMVVFHFNPSGSGSDVMIYRSIDGGNSWVTNQIPQALEFYFNYEPEDIFRTGGNLFIYTGGQLIKSLDNGATWTDLTNQFPDYASELTSDGSNMLMATYFELYLSTNQGQTWTFLDSLGTPYSMLLEGDFIMVQQYDSLRFSNDLGISWSSTPLPGADFYGDIVRAISGKLYALGSYTYVSEDNGLSWSALNTEYYTIPVDFVELANNELILASSYEGIYRTTNNGSVWIPSNSGIRAAYVSYINTSPSGEVFAQTGVGDFRSTNGGISWFPWTTPDDYYSNWIEWRSDTAYLLSDYSLHISTDNLQTYQKITPDNLFYNGQSLDFHNDKIYIVRDNSNQILFTSDGGVNWETMSVPTTSITGWNDLKIVNDVFLLVGEEGEVYRSIDQGATWSLVLEFWAPGVTYNPIYQSGPRLIIPDNDGWWYSINDGATWTGYIPTGMPISDQFDDAPEPSHIIQVGNLLFATVIYHGVYMSADNGVTWQAINDGLETLRIGRIAYSDSTLYLATASNGVWKRGANFEAFSGIVYRDDNGNGNMDAGELPIKNVIIEAKPLNTYTTSTQDGSYVVYGESLNDTIRAIPPSPYAIVNPSFYLANQVSTGKDFGIYLIPEMNDLCITLTEAEPFRPGFDSQLNLTVSNVGTTDQTPNVWMILPVDINFLSASPTPSSISGDTIFWQLGSLPSLTTNNILVNLNAAPSLPLGNTLYFQSFAGPVSEDQNPDNNFGRLYTTVVGSYDPNDKQVSPKTISPEQLAQENTLVYTIRFQNTGTYYAENVRIVDTLSTLLDIASLQVLAASHQPLDWFLRDGRVLEFNFKNIFLPDSTTSEPESHGFVKFSIRTSPGLSLGDCVKNDADIYFDFNSPIHTEEASTLVSIPNTVREIEIPLSFLVTPNPNIGSFEVKLPVDYSGSGSLTMLNSQGQVTLHSEVLFNNGFARINATSLSSGNYIGILKIQDRNFLGKIIMSK